MLLDGKNQTWHDKIADTFVVKLDTAGKLIPLGKNETVTRNRKVAFWIILLLNPFSFATYFLVTYIFLFRPFQVTGDAMYPTYIDKEYLLTNIVALKFGDPKQGDNIAFKAPSTDKDFIKRVIGVPGDRIKLKDGRLYRNGQLLNESSYLSPGVKTYGRAFLHENQEISVPNASYFVLRDNRPYSSDSREWGFVTHNSIISKVSFCYWNCPEK